MPRVCGGDVWPMPRAHLTHSGPGVAAWPAWCSCLWASSNCALPPSPLPPSPHPQVVVPLRVLSNWLQELKRWCPSLRVVRLHAGDFEERKRLRREVLGNPGRREGG